MNPILITIVKHYKKKKKKKNLFIVFFSGAPLMQGQDALPTLGSMDRKVGQRWCFCFINHLDIMVI